MHIISYKNTIGPKFKEMGIEPVKWCTKFFSVSCDRICHILVDMRVLSINVLPFSVDIHLSWLHQDMLFSLFLSFINIKYNDYYIYLLNSISYTLCLYIMVSYQKKCLLFIIDKLYKIVYFIKQLHAPSTNTYRLQF